MSKGQSNLITWRYLPMGEAALLVEGTPTQPLINRYVLALAQALDAQALPAVRSSVPAINSLLITFDPLLLSPARLQEQVEVLLKRLEPVPEMPARVVSIPVIYGNEAGPDLQEVAQSLGLTPSKVVSEHCARVYRVMMIGFAPGFPYIGPLPADLDLPRRSTPRSAVPAGSVAIAAGLTGIYPARLPGGWHLIGQTTLRLFDPSASPPSTLAPGDGVRFVPLDEGVVP
jgi:KipI family sensor histidine kinase inhibitor